MATRERHALPPRADESDGTGGAGAAAADSGSVTRTLEWQPTEETNGALLPLPNGYERTPGYRGQAEPDDSFTELDR